MATTIFADEFESTSSRLLRDPRLAQWQGSFVEIWLFEDRAAREQLGLRLKERGIRARVRSAYKPLLHYVLEECDLGALREVLIAYPCHPEAAATRFLSEAYPLAELLPQSAAAHWVAMAAAAEPPHYRLTWEDRQGVRNHDTVFAPNRLRADHLGNLCFVPCGHVRVSDPATGQVLIDEPLETEIELLFHATMRAVCAHPWGDSEPYFERLEIQADVPGAEVFGADASLMLSTLEALHEDLYFSVLEFFQQHSGRPTGDRGLQPGQIVPVVWQAAPGGFARVRVIAHAAGTMQLPPIGIAPAACAKERPSTGIAKLPEACAGQEASADLAALAALRAPLAGDRVSALLATIDGVPFTFRSRQGRVPDGMVRAGSLPPIVVTGGQHANEASGVVGALRGAAWLAQQPNAHFACVPLENPDGYALFAEYRSLHPQHMHHAARYTGLGDDLEYREHEPWYERAGRMHALTATGAQLHLSLHGYPAHEWTRPFTGYLPRGFALWSVPKGYFLILRYRPGWKEIAREFLARLTRALSAVPGLVDFNARQLRCYETHAGKIPFEVNDGIACMVSQNDRQVPGIVLVTEFPDETIEGEAFVFAHEVQWQTVRLASEIWWDLGASRIAAT